MCTHPTSHSPPLCTHPASWGQAAAAAATRGTDQTRTVAQLQAQVQTLDGSLAAAVTARTTAEESMQTWQEAYAQLQVRGARGRG